MPPGRYQVRGEILIDAPIERVFDVAADPHLVPRYADEIARIDVLERLSDDGAIVRSVLKLGPLRLPFRYRYRCRRPRMYAGFQERGLVRGYFSFSFHQEGPRTHVRHVEGLQSAIPGLAQLAGLLYFRVLRRNDLVRELHRLAELVKQTEQAPVAPLRGITITAASGAASPARASGSALSPVS